MKHEDLIKTCEKFFNQWFFKIKTLYIKGGIGSSGKIHCGNTVQIFESKDHIIIELSGSEPIELFKLIYVSQKIIKVNDTTNHLLGGSRNKDLNKKDALMSLEECRRMHFINSDFFTGTDSKIFKLIYDEMEKEEDQYEIPFLIDSESNYILFDNCQFGYHLPDLKFFFRIHSFTLIIKKNIKKEALLSFLISTSEARLKSKSPIFMGLFVETEPNIRFRKELFGLANQPAHETRIDSFINRHNSVFSNALNYKSARSNINLKIIDKEGWDKETLIPDYLMEREDGSYDILDLKKGLINSSLTIGGKSRRRLNAYCYELVAQLEGYKKYFDSAKNSQWALENYGVKLNHSPLLIGIIGNQNSFFREEIDEALLVHREHIVLLSYNDVCDLFKSKSRRS